MSFRSGLDAESVRMKVKVTIENRKAGPVHHVTEINRDGDLVKAVGVAMETYRKIHEDVPLFDHSTITIERA